MVLTKWISTSKRMVLEPYLTSYTMKELKLSNSWDENIGESKLTEISKLDHFQYTQAQEREDRVENGQWWRGWSALGSDKLSQGTEYRG